METAKLYAGGTGSGGLTPAPTQLRVARLAWDGGCREPRLASVYAGLLAAPGTDAALKAGIDICDEALKVRDGSADDGWQQVVNRH